MASAGGLLYSWATIGNTTFGELQFENPNQPEYQGPCPFGWHVPSDYEWLQLEKEICENPRSYSTTFNTEITNPPLGDTGPVSARGNFGGIMKSPIFFDAALTNTTNGFSKPAASGGFAALLVGYFYTASDGNWKSGSEAFFWTSSADADSGPPHVTAWGRMMPMQNTNIVQRINFNKLYQGSIRCMKAEEDSE
jgi:uncharacterized protein (TIGR02145 family)